MHGQDWSAVSPLRWDFEFHKQESFGANTGIYRGLLRLSLSSHGLCCWLTSLQNGPIFDYTFLPLQD